jgi:hypothetical protein
MLSAWKKLKKDNHELQNFKTKFDRLILIEPLFLNSWYTKIKKKNWVGSYCICFIAYLFYNRTYENESGIVIFCGTLSKMLHGYVYKL